MIIQRKNHKKFGLLRKGKLSLLIIPAAIFIMGSVALAIETAALGAEVSKLEKEEITLTDENRDLSETIIDNSSYSAIDKKASESGFIKTAKVVYMNQEEGIAKLP